MLALTALTEMVQLHLVAVRFVRLLDLVTSRVTKETQFQYK